MSWYEDDLTALAFCWRLQRADGVALGFTSHDRDLDLDGLTYRPAPGMVPSAIERREDFQADSVSLQGALTSNLIVERDLTAGRWDGARLRVTAVSWEQPNIDPVTLIEGELGGVESDGLKFTAELLGATAALDQPIIEETTPECRATLGDKRCRVDMAGRTIVARIVSSTNASITVDAILGGDYGFGALRWLDGDNAGLSAVILSSAGSTAELREAPHYIAAPGTMVELRQGCDRRFATCSERFQNAPNFRGEPHLPGNDLLVRYAH